MSLPTSSDVHPTVAAAAPDTPTILRKSRRLTPLAGLSWLIRLIEKEEVRRRPTSDLEARSSSVVAVRAIVPRVPPRAALRDVLRQGGDGPRGSRRRPGTGRGLRGP